MRARKNRAKINKIKYRIRIFILAMIFSVVIYVCIGIYKESKIKLLENTETTIEKMSQTNEIKDIQQKETETIPISYLGFEVIAKLTIPKINLDTYVLEEYTTEGMKVCASKFWGPEPNEIGNFCIAGHNYQKENMFNHLIDLEVGDTLYLSDNKNGKHTYIIYDIYRVKPENTASLEQETNDKRIVTLITCVNYSKNRLIVQAMESEED